jgi:hypothetical protein
MACNFYVSLAFVQSLKWLILYMPLSGHGADIYDSKLSSTDSSLCISASKRMNVSDCGMSRVEPVWESLPDIRSSWFAIVGRMTSPWKCDCQQTMDPTTSRSIPFVRAGNFPILAQNGLPPLRVQNFAPSASKLNSDRGNLAGGHFAKRLPCRCLDEYVL